MQYILSLLPLLACPVGMGMMMWFMMRGMSGNGKATASQPAQMQGDQVPAVGLTRDEQLAELKSRLSSVQAEQEATAGHIAEIESPEVPVISEAEAVARAAQGRNRKRTAHRRR